MLKGIPGPLSLLPHLPIKPSMPGSLRHIGKVRLHEESSSPERMLDVCWSSTRNERRRRNRTVVSDHGIISVQPGTLSPHSADVHRLSQRLGMNTRLRGFAPNHAPHQAKVELPMMWCRHQAINAMSRNADRGRSSQTTCASKPLSTSQWKHQSGSSENTTKYASGTADSKFVKHTR